MKSHKGPKKPKHQSGQSVVPPRTNPPPYSLPPSSNPFGYQPGHYVGQPHFGYNPPPHAPCTMPLPPGGQQKQTMGSTTAAASATTGPLPSKGPSESTGTGYPNLAADYSLGPHDPTLPSTIPLNNKNPRSSKPTKAPQRPEPRPATTHHQGKIPSRKKRVRGRPPKTDRPAIRRSSSSKSQRKQPPSTSLNIQIVSDEDPSRIVNPLLEIPSESTQTEPIHGSELITLTNLSFYRPDTYPISYLGRLLGFDIPVPSVQDSKRPVYPTPLPDVDKLPLLKKTPLEDIFFRIPPRGPLPHWNEPLSRWGDYDDQCTLDYIDPVYAHFLQRGWNKAHCRAVNSTLLAKLTAPPRKAIRASVLELAQKLQLYDSNDWTFGEWTPSTGTLRPQWTLEDQKVYTAPPTQTFGVVASFQGEPVALIHYRFQWYPMLDKMEAELIMVLEGIVKRSGTEVVLITEEVTAAPETTTTTTTATTTMLEGDDPSLKDAPAAEESAKDTAKETLLPASEHSPPLPTIPNVEIDENIRLILIALALEHARSADVWYCLWNAPPDAIVTNKTCFRMVTLPCGSDEIPMICDLKKCNSRYALLKRKELQLGKKTLARKNTSKSAPDLRILVKLPLLEETKSCFDEQFAETQRSKRASTTNADSMDFTGATGKAREVVVGVRATLSTSPNLSSVKFQRVDEDGTVDDNELVLNEIVNRQRLPQLDILRRFALPVEDTVDDEEDDDDDEILNELKEKQSLLLQTETGLEPRLRALMSQVVAERLEYEKPEAKALRAEERLILKSMEEYLARRKELDLAREEQREQDMNAVCNICNDGEVSPDNQILFCEACDVPIHQMCYGIEEIPEGDYYCVACRHFDREKMSKEQDRLSSTGTRIALPALPIRCELCPVKTGAYIRSDTSKQGPDSAAKWVHMVCAKWQGLNFVEKDKPDLVEDVAELKNYFRRMNVRCAICQGQRGAYHKCRQDGCEKYMHITCARAVGVCEVIHGEDVEGPVATNPWTLMCPEHSQVDPDDVPEDPVPVAQLIEMAKELPDDPMPEPPPEPLKPFNKLTGKERRRALADLEYERQFLDELLTRRFAGLRCEVCWALEDDGKGLARCSDCDSVICCSCRYSDQGEVNPEQKQFKCFSCRYIREKAKANEPYETPKCHLCNQTYGLLLESYANPVNRLSYWKNNEKEFKRTIFARKLWTHYACAFWLESLEIDGSNCKVNCSNVVMSNGMGYVRAKNKCILCGLHTGLKAKCADPNCRARGEKRNPYWMHVTCARQAGYEVQHEDDHEPPFYVKCYFHGGCEYNLRARVEDLIEIEKRRSGKHFSKADSPMSFSDGSRLLSHAIVVMRMLGWAWRWAEHWVEYGSNWEPLLEPGQKEEQMTKKQLKIVDSTPESRAEDARRCRLAAFGAALRSRAYDTEQEFDNGSLCRALNAILHTPSLVGPLTNYEIDFCVEWLSRAYRSKSKFLGLGENKVKVANDDFCVHQVDKSPKYDLGDRPLPGKAPLEPDQIFENKVDEPDDFLLPELLPDGSKCPLPLNSLHTVPKKIIKFKKVKEGKNEEKSSDDEEALKKSSESKSSETSQSTQKATKKEKYLVESLKKKRSRSKQAHDDSITPSRSDYVAAMVPSAVKKRGSIRTPTSRVWTPSTASPQMEKSSPVPVMKKLKIPAKKRRGIPALEAHIDYQELIQQNSGHSVLRQHARRGRPPKLLEMAIYFVVGGDDYFPGDIISAEVDCSVEEDRKEKQIIDDSLSTSKQSQSMDAAVVKTDDQRSKDTVSIHDKNEHSLREALQTTADDVIHEKLLINVEATAVEEAAQVSTTKSPIDETVVEVRATPDAALPPGSGEKEEPLPQETQEIDIPLDEPRRIPRRRILVGIDPSVVESGDRKRRPTQHLDPSGYDDIESEDLEDGGIDESSRQLMKVARSRSELSAGNVEDDPNSHTEGIRRSSRRSTAREKSLKEPDDDLFDSDLELKPAEKKRARQSRGSVKHDDSLDLEVASPASTKRRSRSSKKKIGLDNEDKRDSWESDSSHNSVDAALDDEHDGSKPDERNQEIQGDDDHRRSLTRKRTRSSTDAEEVSKRRNMR